MARQRLGEAGHPARLQDGRPRGPVRGRDVPLLRQGPLPRPAHDAGRSRAHRARRVDDPGWLLRGPGRRVHAADVRKRRRLRGPGDDGGQPAPRRPVRPVRQAGPPPAARPGGGRARAGGRGPRDHRGRRAGGRRVRRGRGHDRARARGPRPSHDPRRLDRRARRGARAGVPSPRKRTGRAGDPGGRRGRPGVAGRPGDVRPRARSLALHADYYQVPRRQDGRGDAARGGAAVSKLRVGILGATGTVGQRFVQMLERHPLFTVSALAASDRSQGKPYADACAWKLAGEMPRAVRELPVEPPRPPLDCDVVFSSLPADVGREAEGCFAAEGYPVISNTSSYRMDAGVPLLVPEVNPEHLALLDGRDGGFIVTNPNCSAVMIALALAPLHRRFGIAAVAATTLQALSGAGYPGVSALDITDNVLPFIANEEQKIERETQKILGSLRDGAVEPAPFPVSAQCHRVNVQDGHMAAVRVKLGRPTDIGAVRAAFAAFTGVPQQLRLHTAPERPL